MAAPPDPGLSAPTLSAGRSSRAGRPRPRLTRDGIRWSGGRGGRPLVLALSFENPGDRPTRARSARVQVAAFGAFLNWRDVTAVDVPEIEPGESEIVTGVAPGADLPAAPRPRGDEARILDVHFVGNINVFVTRDTAVERHVRRTIGLRAGRPNQSLFFVGDGRPDSYTFDVGACEPGWRVDLYRGDGPGAAGTRPAPVTLGEPVLISRQILTAVIEPPEGAETGRLAIGVERGTTAETALVEFELETSRLGSRCYYL